MELYKSAFEFEYKGVVEGNVGDAERIREDEAGMEAEVGMVALRRSGDGPGLRFLALSVTFEGSW